MRHKRLWKVLIILFVVLGVGGKLLYDRLYDNLENLEAMEIQEVDLAAVEDGRYVGFYGSFPVDAKVEVIVTDHRIMKISLLEHGNGQGGNAEVIPDKVVEAQSLQIDSVSGATYSSRVILKAIEVALESEKQP
ncbi:MAG TPA: FMN-binding protein [Clostridiaceae bacterium]|nr:FMN-binding protein [Clostridiaceae bacterium]